MIHGWGYGDDVSYDQFLGQFVDQKDALLATPSICISS